MKSKILFFITVLLFSARFLFAESTQETMNRFGEKLSKGLYADASSIILAADPYHNDPDLTMAYLNLCLNYYAATDNHQRFGFVNLKPEENLMKIREGQVNAPMVYFDVPEAFEKIMKKHPERPEIQAALGWFYYEVLRLYGHSLDNIYGNVAEQAFGNWEIAYKNDVSGRYLTDYGSMLIQMGNFKKAHDVLSDALSFNPNYYLTYYYLAICNNALGNIDEALTMSEWAVNLSSDKSLGRFNALSLRGYLYELKKDDYKALKNYEEAYKITGNNVITDAGLFRSLYSLGKKDEIRKYATEIFALDPHEPNIGMMFAEFFTGVDDIAMGTEIFDNLASSYKRDNEALGNIYFHKGLMFYKKGKTTEANAAFTLAKKYFGKVFPDDHPVFSQIREAMGQ